jgi:hypothetical protein
VEVELLSTTQLNWKIQIFGMAHEFYITLPSNVKSNVEFSYNTVSSYKTKLQRKLNFNPDDDWRVGLAEISYTKSWFNLREKHQIILFDINGEPIYIVPGREPVTRDAKIIVVPSEEVTKDLTLANTRIKPGHYEDVQTLCNCINKKLELYVPVLDKTPSLKYDQISNRCTLKAGIKNNRCFFPYLGEEVENILGLIDIGDISLYDKTLSNVKSSDLYKVFANEEFKAPRCAELNAGLHTLYIYSDIVEHNFVGDSFAQLLRLAEVPTDSKYGEQIVLRYDQPHYIPLQYHTFDTILVELKDDTGGNIHFEFGRVIIKLIFKKYGQSI